MKVRATRAYIAGFGTAGSLLAGAAVMFVLASAVVSFRGWPDVGAQSTAASVTLVARHGAGAGSVANRRVAAAVAATRVAALSAPAGAGTARRVPGARASGPGPASSTISGGQLASQPGTRALVSTGTPSTITPPSCSSGCARA